MKKVIAQTPIIYQTKSGALELRGDFREETLWATQAQIAELFETSSDNISLHLKNIYKDFELDEKWTTEESLVVQNKVNATLRNFRIVQVCANFACTEFLTSKAMQKMHITILIIF